MQPGAASQCCRASVSSAETDPLQEEQQDLQEAILRSKADQRSADGVIVARLTGHSSTIHDALLRADSLRDRLAEVDAAGCKPRPPWANGAPLLVPLTLEQVCEAELELKAHNVVLLCSDWELVVGALQTLPRRRRPLLKLEHQADSEAPERLDVHIELQRGSTASSVDDLAESVENKRARKRNMCLFACRICI